MTFGPDTQRFTFYVRSRQATDDKPFDVVVHADEKCARWRGSHATITETSGVGETIKEAAREAGRHFTQMGPRGVRVCNRCIS